MMDLLSLIMENWDALDQSRVNGFLLILLIASVGLAFWGLKNFLMRVYTEIRTDIQEAVQTAKEALEEIRELKLTERDHDGDIRRLKDDVDDLFGRSRHKRRNP